MKSVAGTEPTFTSTTSIDQIRAELIAAGIEPEHADQHVNELCQVAVLRAAGRAPSKAPTSSRGYRTDDLARAVAARLDRDGVPGRLRRTYLERSRRHAAAGGTQ